MTTNDEVSAGRVHITASAKTAEPEQPAAAPDQLIGHPVALTGPLPEDSVICGQCGVAVKRADLVDEPITIQLDEHWDQVGTRAVISRAGVPFTTTTCDRCRAHDYPEPLTRELVERRGLSFRAWVRAYAADVDPFIEFAAQRHGKVTPARRELERRAASRALTGWSHLSKAQLKAIREEQQAIADAAAGVRRTVVAADVADKLFADLPGHCERQYGSACWLCGLSAVSALPTQHDSQIWTAVRLTASSWIPYDIPSMEAGAASGYVAGLLCSGCAEIEHSAGHAAGWQWVWGTSPDACRSGLDPWQVSQRSVMLAAHGARVLVAHARGEKPPAPNTRRWQHLRVGGEFVPFAVDRAWLEFDARQGQQELAAAQAVAQRAEVRALAQEIVAEANSKTISTAARLIGDVAATADRAEHEAQAAREQARRAAGVAISVADRLNRRQK